jgi:hypothetical protein
MIVSTVIHHEFVKKSDLTSFIHAHERHAERFTKMIMLMVDDRDQDWKVEWSAHGMTPSEVFMGLSLLQDKIKEQLQTIVAKDLKL